MPGFESVAPLVLGGHNVPNVDRELAVFIGPVKNFSNIVLRNVEEEIPDVMPVRFDSVEEYHAQIDPEKTATRLVIVDSAIFDQELQQLETLLAKHGEAAPGAELPGIVVAYCSDHCAQAVVAGLGDAGRVQGFLPMNQSIEILLALMRLLISGGGYYPLEIMQGAQTGAALSSVSAEVKPKPKPVAAAAPPPSVDPDILTPREVAVMKHVSNGLQNKQIAGELGVSEHTIKLHIHHIITKLNVSNRTAAAMKFMEVMPH
ncbi:response regulator transcription factor [Cognatishimia sp. SS12]|uniref:response regulator transcription factor n=1 Tax=Cognatishimia sp. SS12 TaxID=2979465 RepID=UPI0023304B8C|nr:response regulator transcription factor [Cognatishimia sp. SS12]MDC0739500.1 response regulator transcription factor [Cognatishimia sp. SS12]